MSGGGSAKSRISFANMASVSIRLNPVGLLVVGLGLLCLVLYAFDVPKLFKAEQKVDMKELLSVAIDLAERGGARVKAIRELPNLNQVVKGKTKEGKDDLKTTGDDESHKAMVNGFAKAFPELKVHSEEHNTDPVDLSPIPEPKRNRKEVSSLNGQQSIPIRDITVWIDPLDATQEYTENLVQYVTTMVCIAVRGQPKIGVIHFPFTGETIWGWVGYGASPSLKQAGQQDRKQEKEERPYKIIVSRSHKGKVGDVISKALGNQTVITAAGGAGYKTVQVIKGEADAYVHVTAIKKWDICAGNAIILSVEGTMTTLDGFYVDYAESAGKVVNDKGLLATVHDHQKLLNSLQPAFEASKKKEKSAAKGGSSAVKRKRSTTVSAVVANDSNNKNSNPKNNTDSNRVKEFEGTESKRTKGTS